MDLFEISREHNKTDSYPLAERMKPTKIEDFFGQEHILGEGKLLRRLITSDRVQSLILYGPSGTGKTSLSRIIANSTNSEFVTLNAVTSGIKDLKEVVSNAKDLLGMYQKKTILFLDEIHRFNKAQQDALLPHVEKGTITLIGATTENPYFEVNHALLSRSMLFQLEKLDSKAIKGVVLNAISDDVKGLGVYNAEINEDALEFIADVVDGDARAALNAIELAVLSSKPDASGKMTLDLGIIEECVQKKNIRYDKNGDQHYDVISAFIKSMRGSDMDATLHYLARMICAGEDPKFIARRIIIAASEDVGLADSNALVVANNAAQAVHFVGMPEARIILAHAASYVARAPKSNAAYMGINLAIRDVNNNNIGNVPSHLKDSTSKKLKNVIGKEENHGQYLYPHDYDGGYIEQQYLPDELSDKEYYFPKNNGRDKVKRTK